MLITASTSCPMCGSSHRADPNIAKNPPRLIGPMGVLERASQKVMRELYRQALIGRDSGVGITFEGVLLLTDIADLTARAMMIEDATARQKMVQQMEGGRARPSVISKSPSEFVTLPMDDAADFLVDRIKASPEVLDDMRSDLKSAYSSQSIKLRDQIGSQVFDTLDLKLAEILREGGGVPEFRDLLKDIDKGALADKHIDTVFRTSRTEAAAAGRVRQSFSPELDDFIIGYKYKSVNDADARPDHKAMHNLQFEKRHPIWARWMPPNGWNCRCRVVHVSKPSAIRSGRYNEETGEFRSDNDPGLEPDPGFESNPVVEIYGGA